MVSYYDIKDVMLLEMPRDKKQSVPVEYSAEILSPQKRQAWKQRLAPLSRTQLKAIAKELISAYDAKPADREREIAETHYRPELVAKVIRTQGKKKLQEIYCSAEQCMLCPHGPYWYAFREMRKRNQITVRYVAKPALDEDTLKWMQEDVEAAPRPTSYELKSCDREE